MRPDKKQAFTLVELMVVVLVLGALAAIAIPRITGSAFNAGVNVCRKNVDIINSQIELYHSNNGTWPLNLGKVINDPNYFPDGPPECPFKTPYVLDENKRVPDHLHLNTSDVKKISESLLSKD